MDPKKKSKPAPSQPRKSIIFFFEEQIWFQFQYWFSIYLRYPFYSLFLLQITKVGCKHFSVSDASHGVVLIHHLLEEHQRVKSVKLLHLSHQLEGWEVMGCRRANGWSRGRRGRQPDVWRTGGAVERVRREGGGGIGNVFSWK